MPDAFERFFNITELVNHLTQYLAIKDVSRLACTSRKMHTQCIPSLFRTLTGDDAFLRLFESTTFLHALSRNSQHVRELKLQQYELAFYYNCLLIFQDTDGCRRLEDVIAGPHAIKTLELSIVSEVSMKFAIFSRLFSCCPSSLRRLRLQFVRFRAVEDERGNVVAVTRRQEPLINLKELSVWGILNWHSAIDIRSIFAHCPIINKLSLHDIKGHQETDEIEQFINKQCPRIESLNFGGHSWESFDPIPFRIMESLPPQQITELVINRTVILPRALFPTIVKECCNLNELLISDEQHLDSYITFDDALRNPWSCTKLIRLNLGISGCMLPVEFGVKPYYRRPTPITLTKVETQHFSRLENLYRQIGSLTALQELNLRMVSLGEDDPEDTSTNRPGFLHHLSGLKQLRELRGSVSAETTETVVTMGWAEVNWMNQNWPELRQADFFEDIFKVRKQFQWLQDKRTSEGRSRYERVFDTTELVNHLAQHFASKNILRLTRTSSRIHRQLSVNRWSPTYS
ncbi:MAG: hypothetical protein JOS17DRAFT_790461 [Linnemannia elongata]|nr:MAG: hypothetical protein JOS17DRAFT_790461 [Linnemannia elongata]